MGMRAALAANNAVRFGLELTALTILGVGGWRVASGQPMQLALAVAAPLVAATAWGLFVAPRASYFLSGLGRLGVEIIVFGSAALVLIVSGHPTAGAAWTLLAATNIALVHVSGQDIRAHRDALGSEARR